MIDVNDMETRAKIRLSMQETPLEELIRRNFGKFFSMDGTKLIYRDMEDLEKSINNAIKEYGGSLLERVWTPNGPTMIEVESVVVDYDTTDEGFVIPQTFRCKFIY